MCVTVRLGAALLTCMVGSVAQIPRGAIFSQTKPEARETEREDSSCFALDLPRPRVSVHLQVLNSRSIELPKPEYPIEAKAAKVSGVVKVIVVVDEDGKVIWARIQSGHPLLQSSVRSVACRARFKPIKVAGRPIKAFGVLTYRFVLP